MDLQQRNELSQNNVNITQEQVNMSLREKDNLQLRMKELSDQREYFCSSIGTLEGRITSFRGYINTQNELAQRERHRLEAIERANRTEEERKSPPKRK